MNTTSAQATGLIRRFFRAAGGIIGECNYAARRLTERAMTGADPHWAPDTYAEFLARISAPPARKPSPCRPCPDDPAGQRATGRC